jgi:hypothetical protein
MSSRQRFYMAADIAKMPPITARRPAVRCGLETADGNWSRDAELIVLSTGGGRLACPLGCLPAAVCDHDLMPSRRVAGALAGWAAARLAGADRLRFRRSAGGARAVGHSAGNRGSVGRRAAAARCGPGCRGRGYRGCPDRRSGSWCGTVSPAARGGARAAGLDGVARSTHRTRTRGRRTWRASWVCREARLPGGTTRRSARGGR